MCCQDDLELYSFTLRNPITDKRLRRLCGRLEDAGTSTQIIAAVRAIARTRHPQAIEILGAILDSSGPVGRAAVKGLAAFGAAAVPEMQRILRESEDEDAIAHANKVLRIVERTARQDVAA
jgi:hypothetical protein